MMRPATPADRAALGAMLDRTFAKARDEDRFLNRYPHLFTDAAIGQHLLDVDGGAIRGCVGCYSFNARLHGHPLRIAGIGQVGTAPEAQGKGLMGGLLNAALAADPSIDLFWLYGDRQRYGRAGFALGGLVQQALTFDRYAPPPGDGPTIRALDLERDESLVAAALAARPFALVQPAAERLTMLRGKRAGGWTDGEACILLDGRGRTAWAMHGTTPAIVRLVGHQVALLKAVDPADCGIHLHADPDDLPALAALRQLAAGITSRPTCMMRVGRLRPLLAAWAAAHPPAPGSRLAATVLDGGPAGRVRIACADGAWRIDETTDTPDLALHGAGLAEAVFGLIPPAAAGIPRDSALGRLLPLHFTIPECYGL